MVANIHWLSFSNDGSDSECKNNKAQKPTTDQQTQHAYT